MSRLIEPHRRLPSGAGPSVESVRRRRPVCQSRRV